MSERMQEGEWMSWDSLRMRGEMRMLKQYGEWDVRARN